MKGEVIEGTGSINPSDAISTKVDTDKTGTYSFTYTGGEATIKFTAVTYEENGEQKGSDAYTPSVTLTYN